MRAFFTRMAEKPFRAAQIMKWVYHRGTTDINEMSDLSKTLRCRLPALAHFTLPEMVAEQVSNDGTRKWRIQVDEKNCVETVFIPEAERGTLCISSQVGCPLDCQFCATGKQGFNRNLTVAEIIGQLWLASQRLGHFRAQKRVISNVVMMGMGEPLLNFDHVTTAMELMTDDLGFNLANRRVTLSTAGVVPGIDKLSKTSKVSLAVSLHAANDELRDILVPINRRYPIAELLDACRRYANERDGDPITFEYVMLKGINDSAADAIELAKILKGIAAKINLIPFNPFPESGYTCSVQSVIDQFRDILVAAGFITLTRKTRGAGIDAACGQLTGQVVSRARRLLKPCA